jgi:hypothetical protein
VAISGGGFFFPYMIPQFSFFYDLRWGYKTWPSFCVAKKMSMRALHHEALAADPPRYIYLRCAGVLAVHQPIASSHSELVRTALETHFRRDSRTPLTLDLDMASLDHEALRRVVSWMYECRDEPPSIQMTMEMARIASYMQMSDLEIFCSGFIEEWIRSLSDVDADVRQCTKVWIMLATTLITGPTECVRSALIERLMHLRVDDPVVVELLRGSSLDTLARLTCPVLGESRSCLAFAIDLALMWQQTHAFPDVDVLGHIPIEALPGGFVGKLLASGRLARDDARRVRQRIELRSRVTGVSIDSFGWAGRFDCRFGTVNLEGSRVRVRSLDFGTRNALHSHDLVVHTSQAIVVEGRVYMVGRGTCVYLYSEFDSKWHPFGVVPRYMADAQFATAVYRTWIIFVPMVVCGDPCALDVTTCLWTMLPPMCVDRRWPCIAILQGSLYVLGGTIGNGGNPDAPTERLCLSCLTSDVIGAWEDIGLPIGRYRSACVVVGDHILVLGGYYFPITRPGMPHVSSSVASIRVTGRQCSMACMRDMTCARAGHGAFVCGNRVVVLGGSLVCRRMSTPCADDAAAEILDVATGLWDYLDVCREPPDPAAWLTDSGYEPPNHREAPRRR